MKAGRWKEEWNDKKNDEQKNDGKKEERQKGWKRMDLQEKEYGEKRQKKKIFCIIDLL